MMNKIRILWKILQKYFLNNRNLKKIKFKLNFLIAQKKFKRF